MDIELKSKAFIGIWRFMIPLPLALVSNAIQRSANNICSHTLDVSDEERCVHRFVVRALTEVNQPVSLESIADKLKLPLDRVRTIIDKLEALKVFFYRYNNEGINWAYPVTSEDRLYGMTTNDGKHFYAA
jgi:hypothetical protein